MPNLDHNLQAVEHNLRALGDDARARHFSDLRTSLSDTDLRVVIFGEFNRGKSTLINAILGRYVLPAKLIPTTGHATRIIFGTREKIRVRLVDGRTEMCGLDQLDSFSSLNRDGLARDDIELIEVVVNCPLLEGGLVLVDTPGVNEKEAQTRRAVQAISKADLVLLVLDARQLLSSGERGLAMDWLTKELGKAVVFVVNFMNFLDDADQRDVRRRLDRFCAGEARPPLGRSWFDVNALAGLKHALGKGDRPTDHFDALRGAFAQCTGPARRELQAHSRRGQLLAEVRAARQQNLPTLERIRQNAAKVEQDRAVQLDAVKDYARRFEAAGKAQRDRLLLHGRSILDANLRHLLEQRLRGESKENLEASATIWYQDELAEAIREIEKEADDTLLRFAGDVFRRPEAFTIKERMILNARLDVGELPITKASDAAIAWSAGVGAVIGTFVIPIPFVGTMGGAMVGGLLTTWLGLGEADYAEAYSKQATEKWADDARDVLAVLQGQIISRLAEVKRQIDALMDRLKAQPVSIEMSQRESLEAALSACEQELTMGLR